MVGYLIAGGNADGFSFSKPEFFLNITRFDDDFGAVRVIMAHELYHGVQNAAHAGAAPGSVFDFDTKEFLALPPGTARECYATRALLGALMAEGTATYVGDPALLPMTGTYSTEERKRRRAAFGKSLPAQRTLLEMSVRAMTGPDALPEQDVYAVDFYDYIGAPLYDLGYLMSKAIVEHDGSAELGLLVGQTGDRFVSRYLQLTKEPGSELPKLGPLTEFWVDHAGCKPS